MQIDRSKMCIRDSDKGQICLVLGGQHPSGGKAGGVDKQGIGDDQLERLVIPVLGLVRVSSRATSNLSKPISWRNILMRHRL